MERQFRLVATGMGLRGRQAWVQILALILELGGFGRAPDLSGPVFSSVMGKLCISLPHKLARRAQGAQSDDMWCPAHSQRCIKGSHCFQHQCGLRGCQETSVWFTASPWAIPAASHPYTQCSKVLHGLEVTREVSRIPNHKFQ